MRRLEQLFHVGQELIGGPVVGGVPPIDAAALIDDDGREGVRDGAVLLGRGSDEEEMEDGGEFFLGRSGEVPVGEFFLGIAAGVGASVAAEDSGGVVCRVEADAEEVSFRVEGGVDGERLVNLGEVAAHARAVICERAAGVDEGDEQNFAAELRDVDDFAALVEEPEVGDGIAGVERLVDDGRLVVGFGLANDDDVVEGALGVGCEEVGGDGVSGMELTDDAGVPEGVGHDHGLHVAGDGVGVERDRASGGVGGDDDSAEMVGVFALRSVRGLRRASMATGEGDKECKKAKGKALHRSVYIKAGIRGRALGIRV